jgi:hypothetical protein
MEYDILRPGLKTYIGDMTSIISPTSHTTFLFRMVTCVGFSEGVEGMSLYISLKGFVEPLLGGMDEDMGKLPERLVSLEVLLCLAKGEVANSKTLLS